MSDLRLAFRSLVRTPSLSAVVVITLGLGLGANAAMFSVVDAVVLHPLPFADANRLMALFANSRREGGRDAISYPNYVDLRASRTFAALAIWKPEFFNLAENGRTEQVIGQRISADYLTVLAAAPIVGRAFTAEDDRRNAAPVAMIGEGLWTRRFARTPNILGQRMVLNGTVHTVVGVVPERVRILTPEIAAANDIFVPIGQYADPVFLNRGSANDTNVVGRLARDATIDQARSEVAALGRSLAQRYPDFNTGVEYEVVPLAEVVAGTLTPAVLALFGAVGLLLLIACANVANLLLVRATSRSHEFAVRLALGARREQLLRLVFVESAVLTLGGGVLGALAASRVVRLALGTLPVSLPPVVNVSINATVVAFMAGVVALTTVLVAVGPMLALNGRALAPSLRATPLTGVSRHRGLQGFVVAQVALTVVLLAGAGLIVRSLDRLWILDPGFAPAGVHTFRVSLSRDRAPDPAAIRAAYRQLDERLGALPGVEAASMLFGALPMAGNTTVGFQVEGEPEPVNRDGRRTAQFNAVGQDYFAALGIVLLRGRVFVATDDMSHPTVAVVDEALAASAFGDANPLGRRLQFGGFPNPLEIVGVVRHVAHAGLDGDAGATVRAQLYIPHGQLNDFLAPATVGAIGGIVRSTSTPAATVAAVTEAVASFDGGATVHDDGPMVGHINRSLAPRRLAMMLLSTFAGAALLLAALGIYGVVSFATARRTREIGLRTALGATPLHVMRLILSDGQRTVLFGIALGLLVAVPAAGSIRTLLYGVSPSDPLTLASVSLLLLGVTALACWLPAWRALRVNPTTALRTE